MSVLKKIGEYLIWLVVSLMTGMCCMFVQLRLHSLASNYVSRSVSSFFNDFYAKTIIIFIGGAIGLVTFFFFVPLHLCVIKKKYENRDMYIAISAMTILVLAIILTTLHYLKEFELDWM